MKTKTPTNDPMIPQNGASKPAKIGPRLKLIAIGTPMKIWPSWGVRSTKGMGMIVTF